MASVSPIPVALSLSPAQAFLAWPRQVPVLALWSGSGNPPDSRGINTPPEARWTILGIPSDWRILPQGVAADDVKAFLRGLAPFADPAPIDATPDSAPSPAPASLVPGWFLRLSYGVGDVLEPAATRPPNASSAYSGPPSRWPLAEAARVDQALIFDHAQNQWYAVGHARRLVALVTDAPAAPARFELGTLLSRWGKDGYRSAVSAAIDLIHAGDCYQVNLSHAMAAPFAGSARALFAAMCDRAAPWHGAYMERDDPDGTRRALLSISPELFLSFSASTRILASRPMKGTRSASASAAAQDLESSQKDHAELAMIVDMMRNDLGRSAELGTVRVDSPRRIEHHGTGPGAVLQATGLISASLRSDVDIAHAISDAFPPASVTGAPKIRAMQIIRDLEPTRRDAYCGCIGIRSDLGDLALNVAIRTAMIEGAPAPSESPDAPPRDAFTSGTLTYHVGAGIVADSDPTAEWGETLHKAGHITSLASAAAAQPIDSIANSAHVSGPVHQGGHS